MHTEVLEDGTYRHTCPQCGQVAVTGAPRHRCACQGAQAASNGNRSPSLARRVVSLAAAEARWLSAGRPVRSGERIAEVFALCQACAYFRAGATEDQGTCRLCGCCLRRSGGLLNKIEMATEGCPAEPPRWDAEVIEPAELLSA